MTISLPPFHVSRLIGCSNLTFFTCWTGSSISLLTRFFSLFILFSLNSFNLPDNPRLNSSADSNELEFVRIVLVAISWPTVFYFDNCSIFSSGNFSASHFDLMMSINIYAALVSIIFPHLAMAVYFYARRR